MGKEIERKYLVRGEEYAAMATEQRRLEQGYLSADADAVVRVRISESSCGSRAYITVKSRNHGAVRGEWEYAIPVDDARAMLKLCGERTVSKTRYIVLYGNLTWEVDVFHGRHSGLVIAEVELSDDIIPETLPPFIGDDVTGDPRYYNSVLAGI